MVSVSCFYIYYTLRPINFTFITYDNYIRVILNDKSIILANEQLASNKILFQFYILSLLCTKDTSKVDKDYNKRYKSIVYSISTRKYWKCMYYTNDYENIRILPKNPFNGQEPKRHSSSKKYRKFMKQLNTFVTVLRLNPINCIVDYYEMESIEFAEYFRKYINYNKKIYLLSMILHNYGHDVYTTIKNHM